MPFLAALAPAIAGGVASAGAGAAINALTKGQQSTPTPTTGGTQISAVPGSSGYIPNQGDFINQLVRQGMPIAQAAGFANSPAGQAQFEQMRQQAIAQSQANQTINTNYANTQNALQGQQNALGTQANAVGQQQGLVNALSAQNGIGNQSKVFNQAEDLAGQLQNLANGNGPNPALAQLAQTTGQNTATQAALQAGQRGAGSNVGLIARQVGQQGAANQQAANGQAATLRAQQQLAGINALQGQQGLLSNIAGNQVSNQVGATGVLQNAAANLSGAAGNLTGQTLGQQQLTNNAIASQNATAAGLTNNINDINATNGRQQAGFTNAMGTGLASGLGTALQAGLTPSAAAPAAAMVPPSESPTGAAWLAGSNSASTPAPVMPFMASGGEVANLKENYKGRSKIGQYLAKGGKTKTVDALVSPGEIYLPPEKAKAVKAGKASPLDGEKIKGEAKVKGPVNSYANDTVHKKLKAGGIVLPRSVTQSKAPSESAMRFIEMLKKKHGVK